MTNEDMLKFSMFHIGDRVVISCIGRQPSAFVWVVRRVYTLLNRGIVYDLERSAERGAGTVAGILETRLLAAQ
ncbi:MAG TPA: hypothetical protein VGE21_00910 [Flavobacteriales bacterium]